MNNQIFELGILVEFSEAILMDMFDKLHKVKVGLEESRDTITQNQYGFGENRTRAMNIFVEIVGQLDVVNRNLSTLHEALCLCESDVFEHAVELEGLDLHIVGMN